MLSQRALICRNNMCEVMKPDIMGGGLPIGGFYDMKQKVYEFKRGLKAFAER